MRLAIPAALILFACTGVSTASAADCAQDVMQAFEKQRTSKAFRVQTTQPSAEGEVQVTVDYIPPDRMLQTVVSPAMPGEQQTMLVGSRAFAGTSGSFEELLPQFTQSVVAEVQTALGKPANVGEYECLGNVRFDGRDLIGYRLKAPTTQNADASKAITRTLYIDPATGLPAYNIVGHEASGDTMVKVSYSYPTDIEIAAPASAPVQRSH